MMLPSLKNRFTSFDVFAAQKQKKAAVVGATRPS